VVHHQKELGKLWDRLLLFCERLRSGNDVVPLVADVVVEEAATQDSEAVLVAEALRAAVLGDEVVLALDEGKDSSKVLPTTDHGEFVVKGLAMG